MNDIIEKLPFQLPKPIADNIRPIGIAVIAVLVLILLFGVLIPSCSRPQTPAATTESSQAATDQGLVASAGEAKKEAQNAVETANQIGSLETSNTKVQALVALLGEDETAKLIAQAKTTPEALWIAAHPDAFAFEGIETQYQLLKLAADEPKSVPFVRGVPAQYPMAEASSDSSLAVEEDATPTTASGTVIPRLYQWDRRWGFTGFGPTAFGLTGAAPTALAMVYQGLSGSTDLTPYDLGKRALEGAYVLESGETKNEFFSGTAESLGLACTEMSGDVSTIESELSQGHVIIANVGPGAFTTSDHFLVLVGIGDDGKIVVNDPNSAVRSAQTWDAETISSECNTMFSFSK